MHALSLTRSKHSALDLYLEKVAALKSLGLTPVSQRRKLHSNGSGANASTKPGGERQIALLDVMEHPVVFALFKVDTIFVLQPSR